MGIDLRTTLKRRCQRCQKQLTFTDDRYEVTRIRIGSLKNQRELSMHLCVECARLLLGEL